jgi:ribosomal protein S18 acetylase RimI-like enzyme
MAKNILMAVLRFLFGEYDFCCIFASPLERESAGASESAIVVSVDERALSSARSETIREQAWYAGSGSHVFAWTQEQEVVGICAFWFGCRYALRGYWRLEPDEAKLVQVVVDSAHRGRGIGPRLIRNAAARMHALGFAQLYARVWHSNTPSLRAFETAGWQRHGRILDVQLLGVGPRLRIRLR